jgi:predicted RecB family endonuclease
MGLIRSLFGALASFFGWLGDRQLLEAGKAVQANEEIKEVEARVEKAEAAVATPDPVRDERLRNRFDRSRGK